MNRRGEFWWLWQTTAEGEPVATDRTPRLTSHGNHLLGEYRRAKTHLEELSCGRQLPRVRRTHTLGIPIRVALALKYPQDLGL